MTIPQEWRIYDKFKENGWSIRGSPGQCTEAEYGTFLAMDDTPRDNYAHWSGEQDARLRELFELGVYAWADGVIYRKDNLWIVNYYSAGLPPLIASNARVEILQHKMILAPHYRCFLVLGQAND